MEPEKLHATEELAGYNIRKDTRFMYSEFLVKEKY